MKDELGDRMKGDYEDRTRFYLPRRTYTLIRIDGKAFHTYTKGLKRPFDSGLIDDMDETACYLCKNIQGAKLAFVQSDEISILLTDFDEIGTDMWFDGNIQKMASVSASMATAKFNQLRAKREFKNLNSLINNVSNSEVVINLELAIKLKLAEFDSRVFTIASKVEVMNYFIFRQKDTIRNSVSSLAQSVFSHKELHGKGRADQIDMLKENGCDWNNLDPKLKFGRYIIKVETVKVDPNHPNSLPAIRNIWVSTECPEFVKDKNMLSNDIPNLV